MQKQSIKLLFFQPSNCLHAVSPILLSQAVPEKGKVQPYVWNKTIAARKNSTEPLLLFFPPEFAGQNTFLPTNRKGFTLACIAASAVISNNRSARRNGYRSAPSENTGWSSLLPPESWTYLSLEDWMKSWFMLVFHLPC